MICYQDRTFCPFWQACSKGETCPRAVTEQVIEGATKWWGSPDFPIALYAVKPECFEGRAAA